MGKLVGSVDQGTSSTRFILFDEDGQIVEKHQIELPNIYPQEGWCEHDPVVIMDAVTTCIDETMKKLAGRYTAADVAAIGITNQRETTVVWDKITGKPLHNAIVWLDLRTTETVAKYSAEADGGQDRFRPVCGLPLSTYFSGMKLRWMLDNVPAVAEGAANGTALFGTIESWLIWNLSGGVDGGIHVSDVSNASRTMLMDLASCTWHQETCATLDIPMAMLPKIVSNSEVYCKLSSGALAGTPIAGALGDQQAATLGQACFEAGQAKNTYGTGCFMLMTTGQGTPTHSKNGLLSTVGFQLGPGQPVTYCLEGSVAIAGAGVQWLRDKLGIIESAEAIGGDGKGLIDTIDGTRGLCFVPAFTGLFAPHWRDDARGLMIGLTQYHTSAHIALAMLEAVCFQTREVLDAMGKDSGVSLDLLKVDGGMCVNNRLMQIQADLLGEVVRPAMVETTALGSAVAAGLAVGVWSGTDDPRLANVTAAERSFTPSVDADERDKRFKQWMRAVERSIGWAIADDDDGKASI